MDKNTGTPLIVGMLILSAVLYSLSFLLSDHFWWLIFLFPVPLLYLTRTINLSFMHGYLWGCIVFALHLSGGIYLLACMAHEAWWIGVALGIAMILYQALFPALLFWCVTAMVRTFAITSPIIRLFLWVGVLWLFIIWVDWYCMWIFGVKEGHPLMHPLIPLVQQPSMLWLLPIIGKQLLTGLFLLVPASCVLMLWYKNYIAVLFFCCAVAPWLMGWWIENPQMHHTDWHNSIKSLPYMAYSTVKNPLVVVKVVGNKLKNIIVQYPETEIIIMPESAFNVSNFADFPELLQLWNADHVGKAVYVIFGASRWHNGNYYNSLHWVYNGVLQGCCDKKHAMLISERLAVWMDSSIMRQVYFSQSCPVAVALRERVKLSLTENIEFVPYICSELFFNEWPDDDYKWVPIMVMVNDSLFLRSPCSAYIQKLLVLLARFKAIQWQRDIIYVSYAQSLFIDQQGRLKNMNE